MTTEPVTASYITTPRQAGRTKAMIDVLLTQANEHGIRIEIVEPVTPEHVDAAAEAIFKLRYPTFTYTGDQWARDYARAALEARPQTETTTTNQEVRG